MKKLCGAMLVMSGLVYGQPGIVYQYSIPDFLLRGQYGPVVSVAAAKANGISLGIGAGVGLGELIVVNGQYFLADPQGNLQPLKNSDSVSYLTGVEFKAEKTYTFKNIKSLDDLQNRVESSISSPYSFYAIEITAKHANITARSENIDHEPYTPIAQWIKTNQNVFSFKNLAVTMVMIRTPDNLSQLNLKYHAHFISDDKKYGGHVFDFSAPEVTVKIAAENNVMIYLPDKSFPVIKNAVAGNMHDFTHVVESQ